MLKISKEQMSAFQQVAVRNFENRAAQAVEEIHPQSWSYLGEQQVRRAIRQGIERARQHGLTQEQNVLRYLEVMFMLGSNFDEDPQYPWAAEILKDLDAPDETLRAEALYESATEYAVHATKDFEAFDGELTESLLFKELHQIQREGDRALPTEGIPEFIQQMRQRLWKIFPSRCEYWEEEGLGRIIDHGIRSAKSYGLETMSGTALFTLLQVLLGEGFASDLLVPWVEPVLNRLAFETATRKADEFCKEAIEQLTRWSRSG